MQGILNALGIHISTSLFLGILLASFLGTLLANRLQRRD
jgi:hypothetical protein